MDKRRFVHRLNQIHKYLQGNAPQYLTETLTINNNVHQYCTRQSKELHLPLAKTNNIKRAFQYMGSANFNSLPTPAQRITNRKSFLAEVNSLF